MNAYCSPANTSKHCFSETSLKKMILMWNLLKMPKIHLQHHHKRASMYKMLDTKLYKICEGRNKYWLWPTVIETLLERDLRNVQTLMQLKRSLRIIAKKELKPEKPESWYTNPKTWLSNYDIQNVMTQYANTKKYKYAFLGVFPIDFAIESPTGVCLHSSVCKINIKAHFNNGKKFIGLITNLDKHDEPGSHWTSTFIVIDPQLQTYGAYYYDSVANGIPSYVSDFLQNVKTQCDKLFPFRQFKINHNTKQHQYKNSECGIFSVVFQLRWLNKHIVKKNNTSFHEIVSGNPYIDDDHMLKIRDILFRPNSRIELRKLKYFSSR